MSLPWSRTALLLASALPLGIALSPPARADDPQISSIEKQIQALQSELRAVKHQMAERDRAEKAAQAKAAQLQAQADHTTTAGGAPSLPNIPPGYALVPAQPGSTPGSVMLARAETPDQSPPLPMGTFKIGGVTMTFGGYVESAGIYRSRNEVADLGSNFNTGIPLPNSQLYHEGEFRGSARGSRVTGLVTAQPDPVTKLQAYLELDFLGAASTSNSQQTNSYTPRLRQAFTTYDRSDYGFEVLAGQAYTLLSMNRVGIDPLQVNTPLTIDSQNVAGYTYARQPQLRLVKSFGDQFYLAVSAENPQTVYYTGPNGLAPTAVGTIDVTNPGGSGYASTVTYSDDVTPDGVLKGAADLGPLHLEAYGLLRTMHDRISEIGQGSNRTTTAGGGGAGAIIHVIPSLLDVQASFLAGNGIGRYGAAQLPDAVVLSNGTPKGLGEAQGLAGIILHATPDIDLYSYAGGERIDSNYFDADIKKKVTAYGYGNPLYNNTMCDTELGSSSDCVANTSSVGEVTVGGWWKFIHGPYGTMQTGLQYSYLDRWAFNGVGAKTPHTDDNIFMLSLRYYPFR